LLFDPIGHQFSIINANSGFFAILGNSWLFLADEQKIAFHPPAHSEACAGENRYDVLKSRLPGGISRGHNPQRA
jgi:hypothetical protein